MARNLQKNADFYRKKVGIVDPAKFDQALQIEYFGPCEQLRPLVAHYFVAHNKTDRAYVASTVLSQPAVHLIFATGRSFVFGVATKKLSLVLSPLEKCAGIRFHPGGFYPFFRRSVSSFTEKSIPASVIFPEANDSFTADLLVKTDDGIADQLENLLLRQNAETDQKTILIASILAAIQERQELATTHEVAQAFGMSERALQNLFTTRVGVGLKWIVMRTRFLEAMERAHAQGTLNWAMVAAEVGYSSQPHFINDFKKIMGMSPRKYVNSLRE